MKKYVILGLLMASAALVLIVAGRVGGQADVNPPKPETITKVYDINDLLLDIPDYHLGGDFVPLPLISQGVPSPNQQNNSGLYSNAVAQAGQQRANQVTEIVDYITENVDTQSWREKGGDLSSISSSPLRAQLIIVTTVENQKAIQKLLDQLRSTVRVVRIRADWLLLSPGQIEKLQKKGADDTAVVPEISRELMRALPADTVHFSGSIVCFNGQTVYFTSGRAKTIAINSTPVVAPYAVGMDPSIANVHEGIALEVTPTLAPESAIIDLRGIVTEPNKAVNLPSTQPTAPAREHIDSVMQDFRMSVRVPLNKPVLVGGATADPNPDVPAGKQLYLIIQADAEK